MRSIEMFVSETKNFFVIFFLLKLLVIMGMFISSNMDAPLCYSLQNHTKRKKNILKCDIRLQKQKFLAAFVTNF